MKNSTRILVGMMLLLVFGGFLQAEENSPVMVDTEASCILKISADPDILPLSGDLIERVFQSSGVYDEALKTVFGEDSSNLEASYNLELLPIETPPASMGMPVGMMMGGGGGMMGGVSEPSGQRSSSSLLFSLYAQSDAGHAKEFMMTLTRNLQKAIEQPYNSRRNELMEQLKAIDVRIEEKTKQVSHRQEQINTMIVSGVTDREGLQVRMNDLRREIQSQNLKREITQNQLKQFDQDKATLRNQMELLVKQDVIVGELARLVDEAQLSVERFKEKVNSGLIPAEQVQEVKERLARANIELAKRQEELRDKAGQKQLMELNDKLQRTLSFLSESELVEANAQRLLKETTQLYARTGDLEILELNLDVDKDGLRNLMQTKIVIENQMELLKKPSVVVIGGTE